MKLFIRFSIFLLIPSVITWDCGKKGRWSAGASFLIALPFDREAINQCCLEHDQNYERVRPFARIRADIEFCKCLRNGELSRGIRYIVQPLFCHSVRINTIWNLLSGKDLS